MKKTIITNEDINAIITKYNAGEYSTHKLASIFKTTHKRISAILKENNVVVRKPGARTTHNKTDVITKAKTLKYESDDGLELIAKCKVTGLEYNDANNKSGALTRHLIENNIECNIPSNTYQRKKYELEHNRKWFEEYFDIIEVTKKDIRKCSLCEWETEDVLNKTGCFENHIVTTHNISIDKYLALHPKELKFHPTIKRKQELSKSENHIECGICHKKLKYMTNTHLKTHNITSAKYKLMYGGTVSESYRVYLQEQYELKLKHLPNTFVSKAQQEIADYLSTLGLIVKVNDKKLLSGIEIDILIDGIKLGIEYNGLYWHSEKLGKDAKYHISKTKAMNDLGYSLIHIFEDEWIYNAELIKHKLAHLCGKGKSDKIYARKCKIKDITPQQKNKFLNINHIQGDDRSKIHYGAFYDDKLVSVMTFTNKRHMSDKNNATDVYELTRFATDNNYRVIGIAGKLLKYFTTKHNPSEIISFGDRRWVLDGTSNMYTKLGFDLVQTNKPDYKYYNKDLDKTNRLHKFGFGKSSLRKKYPELDFSKTERELTLELGYDRIWDCGLFKYSLKLR